MLVNEALNRIWSIFRGLGIADDLTIIEYIARLLLDEGGINSSLPERYLPQTFSQQQDKFEDAANDVRQNLRYSLEQMRGDDEIQKIAQLFDQNVLFQLSDMLAGGRYPTPRHVVQFMHTLAQVGSNDSLADFACGSGGFLLPQLSSESEQRAEVFGIEISPEWAKIARANLLLHGISLEASSLQDGNALLLAEEFTQTSSSLFGGNTTTVERRFSRILMNPPFGEKVDAALTQRSLGRKVSRSETALITIALLNLAPEGVAGVLAPSGMLFSNNSADKFLRTQLVDENTLEAVVAFPKDTFQPYSHLQTNLLQFCKQQSSDNHYTWFFQLEQDGYPAGKGRDLTQYPPPAVSDLPFVEELWQKHGLDYDAQFPDADTPAVGVYWIEKDTGCPGVICQGTTYPVRSIEFIDISALDESEASADIETNEQAPHLYIELLTPSAEPKISIEIPIPEEVWISPSILSVQTEASDDEADTEEEEIPADEEAASESVEPSSIKLLTRPAWAAAIAFFREGGSTMGERPRLLGVAVNADDIRQQDYDLRPERYVVTPIEAQTLDAPTTLLANIYRNQRQLAKRIDNLFGHLELPPISSQKLPSPIFEAELPLLAKFNAKQQEIWDKVCQKNETVIEESADNYQTAAYFTPEDIGADDSNGMAEVTRTLDLLERMGLIVPVTISETQTDDLPFFYRRVTERDLWQSDSDTSSSEEGT